MHRPAPLRRRRLQRDADFTGERIEQFSEVWLRHGLPGALLGAVCLLHPGSRDLLVRSTSNLLADPLPYVLAGLLLLTVMLLWRFIGDRRLDRISAIWVLYLLGVSVWEEWVFRLAVPYAALAYGADLGVAVVLSNAAFGLAHYFTLRWKWYWCVGAALGGMGLSRLLEAEMDLAVIVGIHWLGTFLNTPAPPAGSVMRRAGQSAV